MIRRLIKNRHNATLFLACLSLVIAAVFFVSVVTVEREKDHVGHVKSYALTFLETGTEVISPCIGVVPDIILGAAPELPASRPATEPVSKRLVFSHYFRGPPVSTL